MSGRKKMNLNHTIVVKLNDKDNSMKNSLQDHGMNITEEIRRFLRDLYKKTIANENL